MKEFLIKNIISEILFGSRICESLENRYFTNVVYDTINGNLILEKLLIGEPVSIPELRKMLHSKILNFEFVKLDGEIRPAKGTTMMKYIPQTDHPKGIRPSSNKVATFYDLDKKAWRSVSEKSKEVVMKYGFGEKKKPVFVIKDRDTDISKKDLNIPKDTKIEKPSDDFDNLDFDFDKDTDDLDIKDVQPISKPDVEVIEKKPTYGFRPKQTDKPKEDLPKPGEIEDVIIKPNVGWKPKVYTPDQNKDVKVILPQPINSPAEIKPTVITPGEAGPKPPPLIIEPEEEIN